MDGESHWSHSYHCKDFGISSSISCQGSKRRDDGIEIYQVWRLSTRPFFVSNNDHNDEKFLMRGGSKHLVCCFYDTNTFFCGCRFQVVGASNSDSISAAADKFITIYPTCPFSLLRTSFSVRIPFAYPLPYKRKPLFNNPQSESTDQISANEKRLQRPSRPWEPIIDLPQTQHHDLPEVQIPPLSFPFSKPSSIYASAQNSCVCPGFVAHVRPAK